MSAISSALKNTAANVVVRPFFARSRAHSASAPTESQLSIVTTLQGFTALEQQWQTLEQACAHNAGLFQSFAWLHSWCKTNAQAGRGPELCIVIGFEGGRLIFAWPLMRVAHGPLVLLKWLSEPFGQYGDVLIAPGHCPRTWMAHALRLIGKLKRVDGIWLRHVRADARAADFLNQRFLNAKGPESAPFLDLSVFADEQAYDARYSSVQRKRRKKIRKALEEKGEVKFRQLPSGALSDAAIDTAIAEKANWLKERGKHNRIMSCPLSAPFLKDLSRRKGTTFETVITEMTAGGLPISWEVGFNYGGTHYGFITAHRNELTDLSPSRLHMDLSQRLSLNRQMTRFDLMVPNDPHKESWSSAVVATEDYYLPFSTMGSVFGRVYLRRVRPLMKRFYQAAPDWMLRLTNVLTGRFFTV